ncbi:MAG: DUF2064 domain-containing protein [Saprospiraceae bacterium]|nr:DUF2064 domain-containing protein [Saprospiraceae bacterium]
MIKPCETNTAILIFANSPELEAKKKRFQPRSQRQSTRIASFFLHRTRQVARRTGLPVILIQHSDQHGLSFQERLANAIEDVWEKGYQKQLVIGSDVPELDHHALNQAAEYLHSSDWVLGPSKDGGAYVIGLSRDVYQRKAFLSLPWQTQTLFNCLAWHLSDQSISGACLPALLDIDSPKDLQKLIKSPRLTPLLRRRILDLLRLQPALVADDLVCVCAGVNPFHLLRGPPFSPA